MSKIPLIWMIDEAEKAGLRVTESNLAKFAHGAPPDKNAHQYTKPDPAGTLHKYLGLGCMPREIIPKPVNYRDWRRRALLGVFFPVAAPRTVHEGDVVAGSVNEPRKRARG